MKRANNMKKAISVILSITFILVLSFANITPTQVHAATAISIDGDYSDWSSVTHTDVTSGNTNIVSVGFIQVGDYVYIHGVEMAGAQALQTTYGTISISDNGAATAYRMVPDNYNLTNGQSTKITLKYNSGYTDVANSTCTMTRANDVTQWEAAIPVSAFASTNLSFLVGSASAPLTVSTEATTATDTTATTATATTAVTTATDATATTAATTEHTNNGNSKIKVDGLYDDWENKPHSLTINWNMPAAQRTETNCREVAMILDNKNLYIHIEMVNDWKDAFNGNEYHFDIDGVEMTLIMRSSTGGSFPSNSIKTGINQTYMYYKNDGQGPDNQAVPGTLAYVTVYDDGRADSMELVVPLESFQSRNPNIIAKDISKIEYYSPNIGERIVATSTSTGWVFVLIIGGVIAVFAYAYNKKRRIS